MHMRRILRNCLIGGLAALTALAVYDQLVRAPEHRTWEGAVLGVPYDFRAPTPTILRERFWNPDDARIFTPHVFGVGWSVNLAQLLRRAASSLRAALGDTLGCP